jgi:mannose-6-phosphate isomerase-like protein (cupin superfamily)
MAELTVPSEAFIHTSFSADEIDGGEERLIPGLFDQGSGMRRFATPEDRALRAGFTRVEDGSGFKTYFWYKEIWYCIQGTAEMTVLDRRTGESTDVTLKAGDATYYPEGVRVTLRNNSGDDFYFLYCAVPASNRDAQWIAAMEPEDIEDVRVRREYPNA